ncbi:hypothetical protein [Knoellia sp. LjRoot47]|uniref:hypothetical protein n=1 Tax=Knoellia sp. LjRoot47 TaxID=3342330 RepID=UPI003ECE9255
MSVDLVVQGVLALLLTLIAVAFVVLVVEIVGDRRMLRRLASQEVVEPGGSGSGAVRE